MTCKKYPAASTRHLSGIAYWAGETEVRLHFPRIGIAIAARGEQGRTAI
jgi:hypothetical protein